MKKRCDVCRSELKRDDHRIIAHLPSGDAEICGNCSDNTLPDCFTATIIKANNETIEIMVKRL